MMFMALLIVLASTSPMLTLLHLWQMKEWRWDRLKEHLRREGMFRQLYGSLRPMIFCVWLLMSVLSIARQDPVFALLKLSIELLLILSTLSVVQIAMRKQPYPVFTVKAIAMCIVGLCVILAASMILLSFPSLFSILGFAFIPFLCPLWVLLSWLFTKPLDTFLKMRTLQQAKKLRLLHPNIIVIGITGSVGKTTTKELLAHILKKRGALSTPVHVNSEMGVARWLIQILKDKPADFAGILIIEMGAYKKGEIRLLCEIAKPQLGIITFVGSQHLALFGSLEAIRDAKGELFASLPENGHAFMNNDNEMSKTLKDLCRCPVTAVGTDGKSDLCAFDIEEKGNGIRFTISNQQFLVPIAGTHSVTSILLAVAAAQKLGMTLPDIRQELTLFKPLARTFEVKHIRGVTVLDDTYNASPDSFHAAILWAKAQPHKEKVLLCDGIIELGNNEGTVHATLSHEASSVFSRVIVGNARFLPYFRNNGFGQRATLLSSKPSLLTKDNLLVCIGRVPKTAIDELLPTSAEDTSPPLTAEDMDLPLRS